MWGVGIVSRLARAVFFGGASKIFLPTLALAVCASAVRAAPDRSLEPTACWSASGKQSDAHYGYCVATAGDVNGDGYSDLLVGARSFDSGQQNEGRAFLYHGSANGPSLTPDWFVDGDQTLAFLGQVVAPAGDVNGDGYDDVLVSAPSWDNGQSNEGCVRLYLGSANGLGTTPAWTREGDQATAVFGSSVAAAGDVNGDGYDDVLVGARGYDGSYENEGRVFLFLGSAAGLESDAAWTVDGGQTDGGFGWSVAGAGDVNADGYADVIVGAFFYDSGEVDEGAAFLYLGSGSGPSTTADWVAEGDQAGAGLGWSVATAGDVDGDGHADVIVGVRYFDGAEIDEGAARVYLGGAAGLAATPAWVATGGEEGANFGWSVATAGDVDGDGYADVIVGAPRADVPWLDAGVASVFLGSRLGLSATPAWTAGSAQQSAQYGWSVAAAGDVDGDGFGDVVVGAYHYDNGFPSEGAAFVYRGSPGVPAAIASWHVAGGAGATAHGFCVDYAGDLNADGASDLIAGDPYFTGTATAEGRVNVHFGSESGPDASPDWSFASGEPGACCGWSAGSAGDVNGDGYDDLLVGAPLADGSGENEGCAWLFLGSAFGPPTSPSWTFRGGQASAFAGASVGAAGDVNADGYADVLVGAYQYDGAVTDEGAVFVFHGSASGLSFVPDLTLLGGQQDCLFGFAVASAGDVNGDGFSDVIVGAPGFASGGSAGGRVFVHLGSAAGLGSQPVWTADGEQAEARFGSAVAAAGDVDGDGYGDVLVVARFHSAGETDEGKAFLYRGSVRGLSASPDWEREGEQAGAELSAASSAGDVNADGYGDVLLGIPRFTQTFSQEGAVELYLGSAAGLAGTPAWSAFGGSAGASFGSSVAGRGDVVGDGLTDLLIGARGYADSSAGGGAAFLFAGGGAHGAARLPGQATVGSATRIALLGFSDAMSGVRLLACGRTPAGRGRVRLEWEVQPLGAAFDGQTAQGVWTMTEAPIPGLGSTVGLDETAGGLSSGHAYRWRARLQSTSPFFPHTPWLTLAGNGASETDFRTPPAPTEVPPPRGLPPGSALLSLSCRPNPLQERLEIVWVSPRDGPVLLTVHDVAGRRVTTLRRGDFPAGRHTALWDGRDARGCSLAAGIYFVRLVCGPESVSRKITRLNEASRPPR
jgi:hypothetical protein